MTEQKETGEGKAVDAGGGPVFDPSSNVLLLVEAANKRQDDLRDAAQRFTASELEHVEEMARVRDAHAKELREAEAARVNAIRQVDVLAVNTAADRASAAIQALAQTTTATAETLRAMVASTANSIAQQTAARDETINKRMTSLEQASYEDRGKQRIADPMMTTLLEEVKALRLRAETGVGQSKGANQMWGYIVGALGVALVVLSILDRLK